MSNVLALVVVVVMKIVLPKNKSIRDAHAKRASQNAHPDRVHLPVTIHASVQRRRANKKLFHVQSVQPTVSVARKLNAVEINYPPKNEIIRKP